MDYSNIKVYSLYGRYITTQDIEPLLNSFPPKILVEKIGSSVKDLPIYSIQFGTGKTKIMMWSQMHGNESTTTKAVLDFINFALTDDHYFTEFSFLIIPILNPDGAEAYTRVNANGVDLNRDAKDRSQPETKVLFAEYDKFSPDFCLNLHGQRTIFSAGIKGKPATLSFLAPAQDERRSITSNRKKAMALIGVLYSDLNNELPGGMGLYDDAFNINCTGDTFQSLGVPTILFEAGHYPSDYDREKTRYFVFRALLSLVNNVNTDIKYSTTIYDQIPLNEKSYLDVLIRNVLVSDETKVDIGIQFEERLEGNSIRFIPKVEHLTLLEDYLGHKEIDAQGDEVIFSENKTIEVGDEIDFVIIKNEKILIKP